MFRHITSATAVVFRRSFCRHLLTRPSDDPLSALPACATAAAATAMLPLPCWAPATQAGPCWSGPPAGSGSSCRTSQKKVNSCGGGRPLPVQDRGVDSASAACAAKAPLLGQASTERGNRRRAL